MTEPLGMMISYSAAAAKLAAALWFSQLAIIWLRRGRTVPTWQVVLALMTFAFSFYAWRSNSSMPWLIASGLALVMLIDGLRLWMSDATEPPNENAKATFPLITLTLGIVTGALCTYAVVLSPDAAKINGQPHVMMVLSNVSLFVMFGLLLAGTMELTLGMTGAELIRLPWQRLSTAATFTFLLEILLAGWVIAKLQPGESVEMVAAPVIYVFSRMLVAYIAWCIPRRMLNLAQKNQLSGQASLALSGWIAILCYALAMTLPTAWPWNLLHL